MNAKTLTQNSTWSVTRILPFSFLSPHHNHSIPAHCPSLWATADKKWAWETTEDMLYRMFPTATTQSAKKDSCTCPLHHVTATKSFINTLMSSKTPAFLEHGSRSWLPLLANGQTQRRWHHPQENLQNGGMYSCHKKGYRVQRSCFKKASQVIKLEWWKFLICISPSQ